MDDADRHPLLDPRVLAGLRALSEPDDPEFVRDVFETWLGDLDQRLDEIEAALACSDPGAVVAPAHALKGASATAGCARVRALALAAELAGRDGDLPRCREAASLLRGAATDTRLAVGGLPEVRGA